MPLNRPTFKSRRKSDANNSMQQRGAKQEQKYTAARGYAGRSGHTDGAWGGGVRLGRIQLMVVLRRDLDSMRAWFVDMCLHHLLVFLFFLLLLFFSLLSLLCICCGCQCAESLISRRLISLHCGVDIVNIDSTVTEAEHAAEGAGGILGGGERGEVTQTLRDPAMELRRLNRKEKQQATEG